MLSSEKETLVIINEADKQDGFIRFSTSKESDYKNLLERIGGESFLLNLKKSVNQGKVVEWQCKVPVKYFKSEPYMLFSKAKPKRILSEKQKEVLRHRLGEINKRRTSKLL